MTAAEWCRHLKIDMPFGIGLPVLAADVGLLAAAGVRAIAVNAVVTTPD